MLERRGFQNLRSWTHGVDTSLFRFEPIPKAWEPLKDVLRPVALFVGRVSYEKNIAAFLDTDFPGTKIVCGIGPVQAQLCKRYPDVRWVGLLERPELAKLYASADLLVFPSRADTFGLVMAEAMACGTPVAAYPVDGPLEVLSRKAEDGRTLGGAMNEDLQNACFSAMLVPRHEARLRALDFSWSHAARVFAGHLVAASRNRPEDSLGRAGRPPDSCDAALLNPSGMSLKD